MEANAPYDAGLRYASAISNHLIVISEAFVDRAQRDLAPVPIAATRIEMADAPVVGYRSIINEFQHDASRIGA